MSLAESSSPPAVRIRGRAYPVLLPKPTDPRLHLAVVIVSLQVLGQVAFEFRLSIAQILVAVLTAALLEVAISFRRQGVLLWPASALLTGNGVAFILRVPGTEHGDWWSLHGAWIFAAVSAVSLLSKHVIQSGGRHVFNPSNFGLVLVFLALGSERADPLDFWWGPLSPSLVLALAIIVAGGLAILGRLHLLEIAVGFWLAFAAGIGVLAASGHTMTARWHVGPLEGADFWWTLVSSPEILVFLFFMITDPRTIPGGRAGRRTYAVGVGLLATLLIAPFTTEFAAKVAVLGALFLVCAARPLLERARATGAAALPLRLMRATLRTRASAGALALGGAALFVTLVVVAGIPARPEAASASPTPRAGDRLPEVVVARSYGVADLDRKTATRIARDVVADLRDEAAALRQRSRQRASRAATGPWLAALWERIHTIPADADIPAYDVAKLRLRLEEGDGQGPPRIQARLTGTVVTSGNREPFRRTVELELERGRYRIARSQGGVPLATGAAPAQRPGSKALGGIVLEDVAAEVGLDFRHGAFRFEMSNDVTAMMGGGVCWLDYDGDGWLDLFVVNSYAQTDQLAWEARGGLPTSALFRNVRGTFEDVSRRSGAALPLRGSGCVAADFDLDGHTDLFVTSAGYNAPTDGYDALLWNDGDGTFTEGAREAGIGAFGWHAGAAVGDVNGDGLPDLFVAGYTNVNAPVPASAAGFPSDHGAMRDLLYLNEGVGTGGRPTFREVARQAGIETRGDEHGLGAVFTDVDRDGRLDLYVANDTDPNQLYLNVPRLGGAVSDPAGLGFRLEEVAKQEGVDDPHAGMGIAVADVSLDGRPDLVVTNARDQLHAAFRSVPGNRLFTDARPSIAGAFGTSRTGWGAAWADFDLDGDLDLAVSNGAIPVVHLARSAEPLQILENLGGTRPGTRFANVGELAGLGRLPRVNGRGLAAADYDNDGDLDLAVNAIGGRLQLLRNTRARGHWLQVRLAEFAPGAVVTAVLANGRSLVREVQAGSSYLSSEDPRIHFGLGATKVVKELRVRYPDGMTIRRTNVPADRVLEMRH